MIPSRDYGQSPPGGMVYTPEQTADFAAAAKARRMTDALDAYTGWHRLAAMFPSTAHEYRARGRAALHLHPELFAILEGEAA